MAKCQNCRGTRTRALLGDNVCCETCGHTGPPLVARPVEEPKKGKRDAAQ